MKNAGHVLEVAQIHWHLKSTSYSSSVVLVFLKVFPNNFGQRHGSKLRGTLIQTDSF